MVLTKVCVGVTKFLFSETNWKETHVIFVQILFMQIHVVHVFIINFKKDMNDFLI